jgi:hypothetical protein
VGRLLLWVDTKAGSHPPARLKLPSVLLLLLVWYGCLPTDFSAVAPCLHASEPPAAAAACLQAVLAAAANAGRHALLVECAAGAGQPGGACPGLGGLVR